MIPVKDMYKRHMTTRLFVSLVWLMVIISILGCSSKKRTLRIDNQSSSEYSSVQKEEANWQRDISSQADLREWEWEVSRTITSLDTLPDRSATVKQTLFIRKKELHSQAKDSAREVKSAESEILKADTTQSELSTQEREVTTPFYSYTGLLLAIFILFILLKFTQK